MRLQAPGSAVAIGIKHAVNGHGELEARSSRPNPQSTRPYLSDPVSNLLRGFRCRTNSCLTCNRSLNELPDVFGAGLLASAALDRLTPHCQTVIIRAASYRQKGHRKEEPVMLESSS